MRIVIAIIVFSILILFHELGHFWLAKKNGIIVDEFSLGMGPRLLSTTKNGTQYSLKAFPFGGSCAMRGEDGEESEPGSFNAAPIWGRIAVVAAGPIFNFILAFVASVIMVGIIGYIPPIVAVVEEGSPVAEAGLQVGDEITRFQGKKIMLADDLLIIDRITGVEAKETTIEFIRDGEKKSLTYMPTYVDRYMFGIEFAGADTTKQAVVLMVSPGSATAKAGIQADDIITSVNGKPINTSNDLEEYLNENPLTSEDVHITYMRGDREKETIVTPQLTRQVSMGFRYGAPNVKVGPLGTMKYALAQMRFMVDMTFQSVRMLVTGQVGINELSGPVGVVNVIGDAYESGKEEGTLVIWMSVLNILILLSVNLGIMNLLPLPALDGGRLIFLLIEAVRGKPTNRKVEGMIHLVGIVLLLSLMAYVTFHDVFKLF